MDTIRITTSQNIDIDYEVAGLGARIVARLIDWALFIVVMIFCALTFDSLRAAGSDWIKGLLYILVFAGLYVFYDLICEIFMNGQSIGKRVMKIRVISLDGARPSMGQYLMRWLFRIVDFTITFQLGALITAAVSDNGQRIGDIVAGTTLIKTNPRTTMDHISFIPGQDSYEVMFKEAGQLSEKDVALIQDVINAYVKTHNSVLVYNMATRIREHLNVVQPSEMNDLTFLRTIVRDYGYVIAAQAENV